MFHRCVCLIVSPLLLIAGCFDPEFREPERAPNTPTQATANAFDVITSGGGQVDICNNAHSRGDTAYCISFTDKPPTQTAARCIAQLDGGIYLRIAGARLLKSDCDTLSHSRNLIALRLAECTFSRGALDGLSSLTSLKEFEIDDEGVRDSDLTFLTTWEGLTLLSVNGKAVTDNTLRCLHDMHGLRELTLDNTAITDAGLIHVLQANPNLRFLSVSNTTIGDRCAEYIGDCTNIEHLGLSGTRITDNGIKNVARAKTLTYLFINRTRVTISGLQELRQCNDLSLVEIYGTPIDGDDATAVLPGVNVLQASR